MVKKKTTEAKIVAVVDRAIRDLNDVQDEINMYDLDDIDEGNKAYLAIDDAVSWLESLKMKMGK
jgi:hypothetical protein